MDEPPPAYSSVHSAFVAFKPHPSLSEIPLHLLHHILNLTLDPRVTPSAYTVDDDHDRARRRWTMFAGLRCVDRRFYLCCTAILRQVYLPKFTSGIGRVSSEPLSPGLKESGVDIFRDRKRETAVLDRFIAVCVGEDMRAAESVFIESTGGAEVLRLQPAARAEDLLLTLPRNLVSRDAPLASASRHILPLPWPLVSIALSPGWARLFVSPPRGVPGGKDQVLEVRRGTAEEIVQRMKRGLEDMSQGLVHWGDRVL